MSSSIRTVISQDFTKKAWEQSHHAIHNRIHPDIPPAAYVKSGEVFKVECFDWCGGQIKNDDSMDDVKAADIGRAHCISGPISVEGAAPGDHLEVEILDVQPIQGHEWGHTIVFEKAGFLADQFPTAAKVIWEFEGIYAKSRHIPKVRFPGLPHLGILATAPSLSLLHEWNQREWTLVNSDPARNPPLAYLPDINSAIMGGLDATPNVAIAKADEAARTIPPRENGGNCDIKNLSKGSKLWLPVFIPGANLSVGDIHFSEGDGEIAFCGAIEMHGVATLKVNLIKDGMARFGNLSMPLFMPGPVEPRFTKYLSFEGISVDDDGKQHYIDATLSFRQACLNAIKYFKRFGYSGEQVYMILSAAPTESRINAIVDVPNALCTISVPTEIFEFDVSPSAEDPVKITMKNCSISSE